jgi:hypothetical protein
VALTGHLQHDTCSSFAQGSLLSEKALTCSHLTFSFGTYISSAGFFAYRFSTSVAHSNSSHFPFQIARPTHQYQAAIQAIPQIFVGRLDRLQQIVEIMSEACKQSLKKRGMHVPPWRRPEYLRAKWFSAYKRSTLSSSASLASLSGSFDSSPGYASSSDKENENGGFGRLGWFAVAVPVSRAQRGVDVEIDGEEKVVFNRSRRGGSRVHPEGGERRAAGSQHDVINLEWKPPAVQESKRRMSKSVGSGLAGALMEAGLTGALRQQGAEGQGRQDAFAPQQRQRQPKLQSLAGNTGIKQQQVRPPQIVVAAS